jgi:hypothetical protein
MKTRSMSLKYCPQKLFFFSAEFPGFYGELNQNACQPNTACEDPLDRLQGLASSHQASRCFHQALASPMTQCHAFMHFLRPNIFKQMDLFAQTPGFMRCRPWPYFKKMSPVFFIANH